MTLNMSLITAQHFWHIFKCIQVYGCILGSFLCFEADINLQFFAWSRNDIGLTQVWNVTR